MNNDIIIQFVIKWFILTKITFQPTPLINNRLQLLVIEGGFPKFSLKLFS